MEQSVSSPPGSENEPSPPQRRGTRFPGGFFRKLAAVLIIGNVGGHVADKAVDIVWHVDNRPSYEQLAPRYNLADDVNEMKGELGVIARNLAKGEINEREAFVQASA